MSRIQNPSDIDPSILELDSELKFIQSTSNQMPRVQLKERGESWLIRFLPAALGPKKLWFARVGEHWHEKKRIVCPRQTGEDYGGHVDAHCPVCELLDALDDPNDAQAFKVRAQPKWLTYCIVYAKVVGKRQIDMDDDEILTVHRMEHYRSTFEALTLAYKNSVRSNNVRGILDWKNGSDFYYSKLSNSYRLDKQDSRPIFDDIAEDAQSDPRIRRIMDQMKTPRVVIPSEDDLKVFADKLQDDLAYTSNRGGSAGRGRGRSRGYTADDVTDDSTDAQVEAPAPRRAPAPSPRAVPKPAISTADEDQIPGAEMPPEIEPAQESEPEQQPEDTQVEDVPAPATPVPAAPAPRRMPAVLAQTAPAPASRPAPAPAPASRPAPAPASRPAPAPAAAARPAPAPRVIPPPPSTKSTAKVDDGEALPDGEVSDPIQPADASLQELEAEAELPPSPPPVSRAGGAAPSSVASRIAAVTRRAPSR